MNCRRRISWIGHSLLAVALLLVFQGRPIHAQWNNLAHGARFELADAVQLDLADNAVLARLERVKTLLADRQWDEAIEILCQLAESSDDGKLLGVTKRRYVGLRDWCQLRLASLPPAAMKLYRDRIDPVARGWYEQGIADRDPRPLENVVEQAFASSYGDDALLALGDMALESGNYAAARWHWERIVPSTLPEEKKGAGPPPANLSPFSGWPGYPDTTIDVATVRARLVLASILEGATDRARAELARLVQLHPDARGRLGGHEGRFVSMLETLLAQSGSWPPPTVAPDWPTFAGNPQRNKIAAALADLGTVVWRVPLRSATNAGKPAAKPKTLGEDPREPLSFHPLVVGNLVLVNDDQKILAVRLDTGQPAWGKTTTVHQNELAGVVAPTSIPSDAVGSPRFTMTVFQGKLYARMGSTITGQPQNTAPPVRPGNLVCLDMAAEGRLLWKITPTEGWTLEGSPVVDNRGVYVAMRRHDIRPQAAIACLDPETGQIRWRRFVCSAETPARGALPEMSHNLLTLSGGILYYNTNLGAVAAVRADDGRVLWVSLYPRDRRGNLATLAPHWRRDLNPCVTDHGTLLVAPADSPHIFAFDAFTGQMLWQTGTEVEDVIHLLGTTDDWLIAGGRKLYWISLKREDAGCVRHFWPDGVGGPGFGRGVLTSDSVLWPSRNKLYIFDRQSAQPRRAVDLAVRGLGGGNLVVAKERLLIATEHGLVAVRAFGEKSHTGKEPHGAN